jgi:hypothetical protein
MVTILGSNGAVAIAGARCEAANLWVPVADLPALGWELRPEGVCRGDLCVPIPKGRERDFVREEGGTRSFNVSALASLRRQPVVRTEAEDVFAIGEASSDRAELLRGGVAPDFALPDLSGRVHRLSEYRGRKVFLVSWASW